MRPNGGDYQKKMACMAKCYFDNKVEPKDKQNMSELQIENLLLSYLQMVAR